MGRQLLEGPKMIMTVIDRFLFLVDDGCVSGPGIMYGGDGGSKKEDRARGVC